MDFKRKWTSIVVLMIYPLPQMAIDLYLTSCPQIVSDLGSNEKLIQASIVCYILALGLAQLVWGSLSDRLGRKPCLVIGISLFSCASLLAAYSTSIMELLLSRIIQGISMGCGFSISSAILSDCYAGKRLAQMTSYSAMVYSLSTIFAPVIGSYVQALAGWRGNFLFMAIYGLTLIILVFSFISETLPPSKRIDKFQFKNMLADYVFLIRLKPLMLNIVCLSISYGVMIVFAVANPFIFQNNLQMTAIGNGKILMTIGFAYFLGSAINSVLVKRISFKLLISIGLCIFFISSASFLIEIAVSEDIGYRVVMLYSSVIMFSIGFIFPNCFANALELSPQKGIGAAFIGSAILIGTTAISIITVSIGINHLINLAFSYIVLAFLCVLSFLARNQLTKGENHANRNQERASWVDINQ